MLQPAEPPGPVHLVNGAVNMLTKSSATAFALSDLLSATCRQKQGENAKAVLLRLVELLGGSPQGSKPSLDGRSDAAMLAPSHLLAVLIAENPTLATTAYEQGEHPNISRTPCSRHKAQQAFLVMLLNNMTLSLWCHALRTGPALFTAGRKHGNLLVVSWGMVGFVVAGAAAVALDMIEAWLHSSGLPGSKLSYVPSWVDALLLILDQAIRVQPPSNLQAAKV